jgi:ribonuclease D
VFGIDIETTGLALDDEIRLVQISNGETTGVIDVKTTDPRPVLQEFSEAELVAHNASFEEARLKRHFGIEFPRPMHDTMVMSQVLYAGTIKAQSLRHTLEEVAMRELGVPLNKELQTPRLGQPHALGRAVGARRTGRRDHGAPI